MNFEWTFKVGRFAFKKKSKAIVISYGGTMGKRYNDCSKWKRIPYSFGLYFNTTKEPKKG